MEGVIHTQLQRPHHLLFFRVVSPDSSDAVIGTDVSFWAHTLHPLESAPRYGAKQSWSCLKTSAATTVVGLARWGRKQVSKEYLRKNLRNPNLFKAMWVGSVLVFILPFLLPQCQ